MISVFSSGIASALLMVATVVSLGLGLSGGAFGSEVSLPNSWLSYVAIRPALCGLILLVVTITERRAIRKGRLPD